MLVILPHLQELPFKEDLLTIDHYYDIKIQRHMMAKMMRIEMSRCKDDNLKNSPDAASASKTALENNNNWLFDFSILVQFKAIIFYHRSLMIHDCLFQF